MAAELPAALALHHLTVSACCRVKPASDSRRFTERDTFECKMTEHSVAVHNVRRDAKMTVMASRLLKHELPKDSDQRLAMLRQNSGSLPLFSRYQAGECERVWLELQSLGPLVREDPYAADALAVAYETMARARANAERLARRLGEIRYDFYSGPRPVEGAILRPPDATAWEQILDLEERAGPLPLSIRAWFAVGGHVELTGVHPALSFIAGAAPGMSAIEEARVFSDPVVIYGVSDAAKCFEYTGRICFSDCASVKAQCNDGGDPYTLLLHTAGADCLIHGFLDKTKPITFVQYVRRAFIWGGFPGFAEARWTRFSPPELESLREGLLPV